MEQEPVAWIRRHKNDKEGDGNFTIDTDKEIADKWLAQFRSGYAWLEPLFTSDVIMAERKRCAMKLKEMAIRLAPDFGRTNQNDRHTADVLNKIAGEWLTDSN